MDTGWVGLGCGGKGGVTSVGLGFLLGVMKMLRSNSGDGCTTRKSTKNLLMVCMGEYFGI